MNDLQVVNEADGGPPDFRYGIFRSPIVVTNNAYAVTGQVKRGARFPVRPEHRAKTAAMASRPKVGGQGGVGVPCPHRTRRGCRCRIIAAIEAQREFAAVLGGDGDEHMRPRDTGGGASARATAPKAERGFCHVRAQGFLIGRHHAAGAPLTRSSGTRSKRTRHSGQDARVPICVPGDGRSLVPEI